MKGFFILAAGLISAPALAADVGFGVNLNIGNMPPAPVYAPAPVYVPAPVVVEAPPMFIAPPSLGVSIAVGVPYDMFMVSGSYYVYKGNQWYCGPRYGGPWRTVAYNRLPRELRKHDIEHYRHVRDHEYQAYNRDREATGAVITRQKMRVGVGIRDMAGRANRTSGVAAEKGEVNHGANVTVTGTDTNTSHRPRSFPPGAMVVPDHFSSACQFFPRFFL